MNGQVGFVDFFDFKNKIKKKKKTSVEFLTALSLKAT